MKHTPNVYDVKFNIKEGSEVSVREIIVRGNTKTKERVITRVLMGHTYADVQAAGNAYGVQLGRSAITDQARDRIAWHRREGHEIVIVSASLDVYLGEVARSLGVAQAITGALLENVLTIVDQDLRRWWGMERPRIAVCVSAVKPSSDEVVGAVEKELAK